MMKKFLILLIVVFAIVVFTTLAIFIAPYIITFIGQVLYDKWQIIRYESGAMLVYNWLLGFITLVLCAITFVLFRRNRLRIYTLLFIPHIVSLVIAMFYIGLNISYLGDGFICVESPFSSYSDYRNSKGKVIMSISSVDGYVSKEFYNGEIVFKVWDIDGIHALYNEDGICFLRKPYDDESMKSYSDFYYSERSYDKDNYFDHCRVRFFDKYGNYIITREYGLGGYYPDRESGKLLSEYSEEVDELSDGVKNFKSK